MTKQYKPRSKAKLPECPALVYKYWITLFWGFQTIGKRYDELWMCHSPTSSQFTQCIYIQKKYTLIIYPSIAVLVSIMAHGCDSFRGCIPNLRGLFDGRWGCTQQNPDRFSPLGKPRPCSWAWGKTPRDRWIDLNPTTEGVCGLGLYHGWNEGTMAQPKKRNVNRQLKSVYVRCIVDTADACTRIWRQKSNTTGAYVDHDYT